MRETRERKPVDYSSSGFNTGTGTPSWLKVSAKPATNENKVPVPFSITEEVREKKADGVRKSFGSKSEAIKSDKEKKRKSEPASVLLVDRSNISEDLPKLKKAKKNLAPPPPDPAPKPASRKPSKVTEEEATKQPSKVIEAPKPPKMIEAPKSSKAIEAPKPSKVIADVAEIKPKAGRPSSSSLVAAAAAAAISKHSTSDELIPQATKEAPKANEAGPSKKKTPQHQSEEPQPAHLTIQLLDPSASVTNPKSFVALQEQYIQLQGLYQQLKAQKIQDLEGLLEEQDEYVDTLNSSVQKLADHWKKEAEKQAEIGRLAGSSEFVARAEKLASENSELKQSNSKFQEEIVCMKKEVLEREARMVAAQAQVAELRSKLEAHIAAAQAAAAQFEYEKMKLVAMKGGPVALAEMTPAPLAGHRNTWMQCPTPAVPSPGIGMQFPSPLPQGTLAQAASLEPRVVDALVQCEGAERAGSPVEGLLSLQDERRMDDGVSSDPLLPASLPLPPAAQGLSAGMIQLMASATMTAKKLSQDFKYRSKASSEGQSEGHSDPLVEPSAVAPMVMVMEVETSNQESSNRIPADVPAPPLAPTASLSPSPSPSPGLSLASMTPGKTALLGGVVDFFGFKVLPLRVPGAFEYIHPKTGLRFQMGPMEIEDSELAAEERITDGMPDLTLDCDGRGEGQEEQSSVSVLLYRPMNLGKAKLPAHLRDELMVPLFSKDAFVNQLWRSVNG